MVGDFNTPNLPPDNDRSSRGSRVKPDWSRPSGAGSRAPVPFDSYDHKNMEDRPASPEAFVRSLGKFLGTEPAPVLVERGQVWRWNMHPGAGILTLPWPRHWTFRRKGARDDGHPFKDHVVVGSWRSQPSP